MSNNEAVYRWSRRFNCFLNYTEVRKDIKEFLKLRFQGVPLEDLKERFPRLVEIEPEAMAIKDEDVDPNISDDDDDEDTICFEINLDDVIDEKSNMESISDSDSDGENQNQPNEERATGA